MKDPHGYIKHFIVGAVITILFGIYFKNMGAMFIGTIVALIVGFLKEIYDKIVKGYFSFPDIFFTVVGGYSMILGLTAYRMIIKLF